MATKIMKGINVNFDRGEHLWRIWFNLYGKRWSESHDTEAIALGCAKDYQRRVVSGENILPARLRTAAAGATVASGTVREIGARWLVDGAKNRKGTSNDFYDYNLESHIYPMLGELQMNARTITRKRCIQFARDLIGRVGERTKRPLKYNTRVGVLRTWSALCTWARDEGLLESNPAEGLHDFTDDPDELEPDIVAWTHEEVTRFLATVKKLAPVWYPFFFFAIRTGLRAAELVELRWRDDLDKYPGYVYVQRQYMTRPRKTYTLLADGTRSRVKVENGADVTTLKGRQKRKVKLYPDVLAALADHRPAERAKFLKLGQPKAKTRELVFTGPLGARVHVHNLEQRQLAELCSAAKVPVTTKLHTTRHTFATVLLAAGEPLGFVSQDMGHQDTSTTERHYKHWIVDARQDEERGKRISAAWNS